RYGPLALFFVGMLPVASPALLWLPSLVSTTAATVAIVVLVGFSILTQLTEPMGVEISPRGVLLMHGFGGWFARRRIPLADVQRVALHESVNGMQQVRIMTRGLEDRVASRVVMVMEARWLADEIRRALLALGVALED